METLIPIEMPPGSVYLSLRGSHRRARDGFSWFDPPLPDSAVPFASAVANVLPFVEGAQEIFGATAPQTTLVRYSQGAPLMAAVGQLRLELADQLGWHPLHYPKRPLISARARHTEFSSPSSAAIHWSTEEH